MHEAHVWLSDARLAKLAVAVWMAAVIGYGLWRSRGAVAQDVIRESGPIL